MNAIDIFDTEYAIPGEIERYRAAPDSLGPDLPPLTGPQIAHEQVRLLAERVRALEHVVRKLERIVLR